MNASLALKLSRCFLGRMKTENFRTCQINRRSGAKTKRAIQTLLNYLHFGKIRRNLKSLLFNVEIMLQLLGK